MTNPKPRRRWHFALAKIRGILTPCSLARERKPDKVLDAFVPPRGVSTQDLKVAVAFALSQASEQAAKLAGLDQQIVQKTSEFQEIQAGIGKIQTILPILLEKEDRRKRLLRLEYGNRFAYLDAEQAVLESQHYLTIQQRRANEVAAARAALMRQRDQTRAEYSHKILSDLADEELTENLLKAQLKLAETELRAPIDGVVQQLAVHTLQHNN